MKKRYIATAVGVLVLIFSIIGIITLIVNNRAPMQLTDAATIYKNASDATMDMPNVVYRVSRTLETTVGIDTFKEQVKATVSCIGLGSDLMQVSIEKTLTSGKHKSDIYETYQDGTAYISINNSRFSCKIPNTEYQDRLIPLIPLSGDLYPEINGVDTHEEYVIYLSNASAPEEWLGVDDVILSRGSGTAYIGYNGMLTKSVYIAEFTKGDAQFRLTVITELTNDVPVIQKPDTPELYTEVENPDGLKMLEQASGYITQMENVRSKSSEITYFEAFGDRRTQEISVDIKRDSGWSASILTDIQISNDSRVGLDNKYLQSETFKNGIYTLTKTDTPPAQNHEITEEHMQTYCQNILVSTVMLPEYITQCTVNHSENRTRFTYTANEAFASQVSSNACQTLYQDETLLERISQNDIQQSVVGYLDVDSTTGLPIGSGLQYNGTYTVEGISYQMQLSTGQIYEIGLP